MGALDLPTVVAAVEKCPPWVEDKVPLWGWPRIGRTDVRVQLSHLTVLYLLQRCMPSLPILPKELLPNHVLLPESLRLPLESSAGC